MRDPNRIDPFMEKITKEWKKFPDMRFGQLMDNILGAISYKTGRDIFFIEDDEMIELIENWSKKDE